MTHPSSVIRNFIALGVLLTGLSGLSLAQKQDEEDQEQPWNLSLGANYLSRYTGFGVDLSQDEPAVSFEADIQHINGLRLGANAISRVGSTPGYQESSFHLGYELPVSKAFKLSGVYTYHSYKSDTVSALAGLANTLTLGATYGVEGILVSAGFNLFFGNASANYFSCGVSTMAQIGKMTIQPAAQVCFVSQTVDVSLLPKNRGKGKGLTKKAGEVTTETITGLSSLSILATMSYSLGRGFTVSFGPAYEYSPSDLGARSSQFIWSAGVGYSVDF